MNRNLYRIDGVLLGTGFFSSLFALLFAFGIGHEIADAGPSTGLVVAFILVVGCPLAMLLAGWYVRRYEKTLVQMWQLVDRHNQVAIDHLCDVFSMSRRQVQRAVRRINRRGRALLVIDTEGDKVRNDGRKTEVMAHSQDCAKCGATVAVEVRSAASEYHCPYCGSGLDSEPINLLRSQMHYRETTNAPQKPQTLFEPAAPHSQSKFNLVVFIVLLIVFWPAAVVYAIWANAS
ncbi:MAG: hypothetical protein HKN49_03360 [Gammaproteobacteria bacterium]|nr:hypothetical protein [Gammaproteobacteria bacterium]